MGKKSRRKRGGRNERGERAHEGANDDILRAQLCRAPLHVGDRVFCQNGDDIDLEWIRAVVKDPNVIVEGCPGVTVLPVSVEDSGDRFYVSLPRRYIIKDRGEWTLRHKVGDAVLCFTDIGWIPTRVEYFYPLGYMYSGCKTFPSYFCRSVTSIHGARGSHIAIPEGINTIIEHPQSLRFSVGDEIVFAMATDAGTEWCPGRITRMDIVGQRDYYAVYECVYADLNSRDNVDKTFSILEDNDEHVARATATPRERLIDSIEQRCSYDHIDHLITSFDLDFMSFRDLLVSKAIESASYDSLVWLRNNAHVNLGKIRDAGNNGLLHQISKTSHADRFFDTAAQAFREEWSTERCIELCSHPVDRDDALFSQRNNLGRTFLHELVISGNTRALDHVLSRRGLGWRLGEWCFMQRLGGAKLVSSIHSATKDDRGSNLRDAAALLGRFQEVKMIDDFAEWHNLFCLFRELTSFSKWGLHDLPHESKLAVFGDESAASVAQRLVDFFRARPMPIHDSKDIEGAICSLSECGRIDPLSWIIETDDALLGTIRRRDFVPLNRDEFAEQGPRLGPDTEPEQFLSLTEHAALGRLFYSGADTDNRDEYISLLKTYHEGLTFDSSEPESLVEFFERIHNGNYDVKFRVMLIYKCELLKDDEALSDRLRVLDYLVKEKFMSPPNVLRVVSWRQCGVLRWLVDNSLLDLQSNACKHQDIAREGKDLSFSVGRKIPSDITVGVFLCFAAIEYDDLKSFQWLVAERNIVLSPIRYSGLNVLHLCALLGRAEIVLWLMHFQPRRTLLTLAQEICSRSPWTGDLAIHMAIKQGFTFIAELLLQLGSPLENSTGETVIDCAARSTIEAVQDWGVKKEKPLRLEQDTKLLLCLLSSKDHSVDDIKRHIASTKCMLVERWIECDHDYFDEPRPLGKTYLDILETCCSKNDPNFIDWICRELTPSSLAINLSDSYQWDTFWRSERRRRSQTSKDLDNAALRHFASEIDDELLLSVLSKGWTKDLQCRRPLEVNHLLSTLLRVFHEDASVSAALEAYRDTFQRKLAFAELSTAATRYMEWQLVQGASSVEIENTIDVIGRIATELAILEECNEEAFFPDWSIMSEDGTFNLDACILKFNYGDGNPLRGMIEWGQKAPAEISRLYVALAVEGYSDLIKWVRADGRSTWDKEKETSVVRIAAYLGHRGVLDIFLERDDSGDLFHSSLAACYEAAMLGAAEAGDVVSMAVYHGNLAKMRELCDPLVDGTVIPDDFDGRDQRRTAVASSLVGSIIFGSLKENGPTQGMAAVKWMLSNGVASVPKIVRAVLLVLLDLFDFSSFERCVGIIGALATNFSSDILRCEGDILAISKECLQYADVHANVIKIDEEKIDKLLRRWLMFVSGLGIDIQRLASNRKMSRPKISLLALQAKQLETWSQFDMIKENKSLGEIRHAIVDGRINLEQRYRDGFLFSHMAAAYNRADVLQWLVQTKDMTLDSLDAQGRTVLEVARASNAVEVTDWVSMDTAGNIVAAFASSNFRRLRALEYKAKRLRSIVFIQAWQRGNMTRRTHRGRLLSALGELQRFHEVWDASIAITENHSDRTWNEMKKEQHDIMRSIDEMVDEEMEETTRKLEEATGRALTSETPVADSAIASSCIDDEEEIGDSKRVEELSSIRTPDFYFTDSVDIKLTRDVVRWLGRVDSKYRSFFVRRMRQLSAGDRSRILAKRLTGSKTTIYETYLEQKSGHRILWTENTDGSLLVWYVARHKSVSRLMELIDDAENRSSRQLTPSSSLPELDRDKMESNVAGDEPTSDRIMLDPLGDTPLKLYEVQPDEIEKLVDPSWKPRLYLSPREREVVETSGTVLLLGRSGTGKTCVIGNRMDYDRQRAREGIAFAQLFIARSQGLCDYVKDAVDGDNHTSMDFNAFGEVVASLESSLPSLEEQGAARLFLPSMKMDFARFKRDFYDSDSLASLDALVVWTNIRSFIKGSIEALQHENQVLTEQDYLALGKKRCRLSLERRKFVYATYERYDKYMKELGLWDDCDRVTALVLRLQNALATDSPVYQEVRYNKLYVDEVQDYTQAEIALFFHLCGPGDLFLAGDPAQSVVEGVEFRFEEIRSVGYHLYGADRRHLIPDKPKTVHVNFRSHCGILNVAAAVLTCLFEAFPDSAKQLKEDRGLFQGPRPGVFHKVDPFRLQELVAKRDGIVVLTNDRNVSKWKRLLKDYPLVYGIREAKGLEFQEVVLVDFFVDIPASLQRLWRNLLLGRDLTDVSCRPEIEGHLKLLYTATTRCIQRLFFAETSSSIAGDAFVRWLTTTTTQSRSVESRKNKEALAVKNNVANVETMVRTPDEWRSAGLDNAVMAESCHKLSEVETWLDRAIYCFEQVGDSALASRARTHRLSVRFRARLEQSASSERDMDAAQTELDAAFLTERLLSEGLFVEAREVCTVMLPFLSERAQETLKSSLLSRLPTESP